MDKTTKEIVHMLTETLQCHSYIVDGEHYNELGLHMKNVHLTLIYIERYFRSIYDEFKIDLQKFLTYYAVVETNITDFNQDEKIGIIQKIGEILGDIKTMFTDALIAIQNKHKH